MSQKPKNAIKKIGARQLGERGIIQFMRNYFEVMPKIAVTFGDDVSAVPINAKEGDVVVLKADMLVRETDVPRGMSLWQAARKAVVMNVSDFASKGVQPRAILVSLGLPANLARSDLEEIARGLNAGAREYGAYVVGGDTGEACDLIISIQLFGVEKKKNLMLRNGSRPGDILAVTGFFGKSSAGLHLLQDDEYEASDEQRNVLVDAVLMPKARLREGLALKSSGSVTASIDSSDGLALCLHELGLQSGVGFLVNGLPVANEVRCFAEFNKLNACDLALYGGEEYELVVTVDPNQWSRAEAAVENVGGQLLPIGKATRNKKVILDVDGVKREVEARGYEHFRSL